MIYIYPEKNLRAYPGTIRDTEEWAATYKIRVNVEKSIHHFKDSFCLAKRRTRNEQTLHADLLLAGIAQAYQQPLKAAAPFSKHVIRSFQHRPAVCGAMGRGLCPVKRRGRK